MNSESTAFRKELQRRAGEVEAAMADVFALWGKGPDSVPHLLESMRYSALGPGKRVRPALAFWVAESFGASAMLALPWAVAVEMVHAYSLIHDDLPCMDDDDERRGRPTNHIVHGEAVALLAGDSLLTEAFGHVAASYSGQGVRCARLVELLSRAAGVAGMTGGQALDLGAVGGKVSLPELQRIHRLKTGALIAAAAEGSAVVCGADDGVRASVRRFGQGIGLAFQIADDILDADQESQDGRSYVTHLGLGGARRELDRITEESLALLQELPAPSPWLRAVTEWNRTRDK